MKRLLISVVISVSLLAQQASQPQPVAQNTSVAAAPAPSATPAPPAPPAKQDSGPVAVQEVQSFNEKFVNDDLLAAPWIGTKPWIRKAFTSEIPRVELRPPVRLEDYVSGSKLELSMRQYMDLVLANNTDIE